MYFGVQYYKFQRDIKIMSSYKSVKLPVNHFLSILSRNVYFELNSYYIVKIKKQRVQ